MDRLIKRFDAAKDGDLMLCEHRGVAYQRDMSQGRIAYDSAYLANYDRYANGPIAKTLNDARCAMLARHVPKRASVLDVGAASGAFVRRAIDADFLAKGFDVIPEAVRRLSDAGLYAEDPADFDAVTLWDAVEHMEEPEACLGRVRKGAVLLAAIPLMQKGLRRTRESKHYKPGEHFYYFTADGFVDWMALYGYRLLEQSSHETDAGRESIGAFAFQRDLPDYRDHIGAYMEIHCSRHYGSSATELHLESIAKVVRTRGPRSILDFGCGRSDLVAHFWLDGARQIARYDPALPSLKCMPEGDFDLVLCCDVLEHVPMAGVDKVLQQVRRKSASAVFTISTKPARAKLPDGRNSHVTLLTNTEWTRWLADYFGDVEALPSASEHELVLLAGTRAAERLCSCGGEMQVESFDHPRRAIEWFMRCRVCREIGPSASTEAEAIAVWQNEKVAA